MPTNPINTHLFAHIPTEKEIYETFKHLPYADVIEWVTFESRERVIESIKRNEWMPVYEEKVRKELEEKKKNKV